MGMFDQTARQASQIDGEAFFAWVLRRGRPTSPGLVFDHWDDSRRTKPPGWPERTDDVVAVLHPSAQPTKPTWMIVEAETEPERFIHHRLGVYSLLLAMEVAAGVPVGAEPAVGVVLLNLTGLVNFQQENAMVTLDEIERGGTGLCLLAWIALMARGGDPDTIERCKQLVLREPNPYRRAMYVEIALVFAELTRHQVRWQQALEGFQVKESQVILGWIRRGEVQGTLKAQRADLLKLVRMRLQDPIPESIVLAVEGTNDPSTLDRWFEAAVRATTLSEFEAAIRQPPNN